MKKYNITELDDLFIEAGRTELMLAPVKMKRITNSWLDIPEDWMQMFDDGISRLAIAQHMGDMPIKLNGKS